MFTQVNIFRSTTEMTPTCSLWDLNFVSGRAESKAIATNHAAANVYMQGTVSSMMGGGADSTLLSPDAG